MHKTSDAETQNNFYFANGSVATGIGESGGGDAFDGSSGCLSVEGPADLFLDGCDEGGNPVIRTFTSNNPNGSDLNVVGNAPK